MNLFIEWKHLSESIETNKQTTEGDINQDGDIQLALSYIFNGSVVDYSD